MCSILYFVLLLSAVCYVQNAPLKKLDCKKYLANYGYLSNMKAKDSEYHNALKTFQKTYALPVTGKLDVKTMKQMQKPRCGKADNLTNIYARNPWGKTSLTYKFNTFPRNGMDRNTAINEISRAFNVWAKHIPMNFRQREGRVDIDINFMSAAQGDGIGNTLAYAYYPKRGDIYFDAEPWTAHSHQGTNLFNTAAHEIGHSLGLSHSNDPNALMNPYIISYTPNLELKYDDVKRIQNLYGKKTKSNQVNINLCKITEVDAALFSQADQSLYLIKDNVSWKLKGGKIQSGYPKDTNQIWPGIPEFVDAAYYYRNDVYFAKDLTIWKYDGKLKHQHTLLERINAGVIVNEKLYLFAGSDMYSFDMSSGTEILEQGYPRKVSEIWQGAPQTIDAVFYDQKNFYMFKDSTVYTFNSNRKLIQTVPLRKWLPC